MFVRRLPPDKQEQRRVRVPGTVRCWTVMSFSEVKYSKINSIKSHDSGAGKVCERRLMSQSRRMREFVCAMISMFLQSERWCQYSSANAAAAIM